MINMRDALKSNRLMKALTGLKLKQFKLLVSTFEIQLKKTFKQQRGVNINKGRDFKVLKTSEEKLFYILFYIKTYPTFDLAGFIFNVNRSSACRWTHWFIRALEKTLSRKLALPKRKLTSEEELLAIFPDLEVLYVDGTERPRRRPGNKIKQKKYYSGKKKRHTLKNLVVTDKKRRVCIITKTKEGKLHDYANFKKENLGNHLPRDIPIYVDSGFQGIEKDYPALTVRMPKRKVRGKELTKENKENNKAISSKRVLVEHAIGGVKRLRSVTDIYRNIKTGFEDKLILNACGIWNFYLKTV